MNQRIPTPWPQQQSGTKPRFRIFPAGATIQRSGKNLLVISRKTVYAPVLGRGKDAQREYLGRVVDGVVYTREEYRRTFRAAVSAICV